MTTRRALHVALLLVALAAAGCGRGPKGPFCQSCAMPMEKPELFGTNADGSKSADYCSYCFLNGKFTQPDITMQQMIDQCVKHMAEQKIMPEKQARELMTKYLPALKRWKPQQ